MANQRRIYRVKTSNCSLPYALTFEYNQPWRTSNEILKAVQINKTNPIIYAKVEKTHINYAHTECEAMHTASVYLKVRGLSHTVRIIYSWTKQKT